MIENLANTLIPIILLVLVGVILSKFGILKDESIRLLNKIVLYVSIPALTFLTAFNLNFGMFDQFWAFTVTSLIVGILGGAIVFGIAIIGKMDLKRKWGIIIPVVFGSTTFTALPLVTSLYNQVNLVSAIKFYDFTSYIFLILLNVILVLVLSSKNNLNGATDGDDSCNFCGSIVGKIFLYPIFLAFILGIIANFIGLPKFSILVDTFGYLAALAIPVLSLVIGAALKFDKISDWLLSAGVSIIKIVIVPIIALVCFVTFGISSLELNIGLISAAVPSGLATMAISIDNNLDYAVTAKIILISIILSLITLPLLTMFI